MASISSPIIIASSFDPHIRFAMVGIAIGVIIPFIAIPFLERWVVKSKHHIIVGDHEDIKEDIETKHKWKKSLSTDYMDNFL